MCPVMGEDKHSAQGSGACVGRREQVRPPTKPCAGGVPVGVRRTLSEKQLVMGDPVRASSVQSPAVNRFSRKWSLYVGCVSH